MDFERMLRLAVGAANNASFLTNLESPWRLRSYFETVMPLLPAVQREIETHSHALRIRRRAMAQVLQIRVALREDLIQRRAERVPAEAHRIQKVALARAVRAHQNGYWTKRHIASGDALVVLQSYSGYSTLS